MALRESSLALTTPAEVDAFVSRHAACAIFKSGACHKTAEAFRHVQERLRERPDLPLGLLDVLQAREASQHVAARTGIRHESPQIILFVDGQARFDLDNWDITAAALAAGLDRHLAVSPA